jgi:glycosyltransferase involved in cell wall biosynthesis
MYRVAYSRRFEKEGKAIAFLTSYYFNNKITEGHKILSDRIINAISSLISWNILVMSLERIDIGERTGNIHYHETSPRYIDWLANTIKSFHLLRSADIIHLLAYNKIFSVLLSNLGTARRQRIIAHLYYHPLAFRDPRYLPIKLLSKLQMFDAIIATSKALKEYFVEYSPWLSGSVFFVPPLVPEDLFQFDYTSSRETAPQVKMRYGLSENDLVVTYIGHIIPQRGVFELIKAFKDASKCDSSLKLVISHSGIVFKDLTVDYLVILRRLIMKYGLEKRVILTGKKDLRELYTLSDVLFFGFRDSFYFTYPPLVVCEAMAAGVPFILRSSMLVREVFENTPPVPLYGNVDQLVDILCGLPGKSTSLHATSKTLKEIATMNYHPSVVTSKLLKVYAIVLEK